MNVIKTDIEGVLIIEPRLFRDGRGYFFESFSEREFDEKVTPVLGHKVCFCQDNESKSSYGVMRGLHFQRPPYYPEQTGEMCEGKGAGRGGGYPQGVAYLRQACGCGVDGGQPPAVLHPQGLRPWFRRALGDGCVPV